MNTVQTTINAALAALLLSVGTASATLVCPGGQTYPQHGPGDYEYCPPAPTPEPVPVGDVTNTITNTANAAAISAAQAKARAKAIAKQRQKQRQRQQQNQRQRQSQNAYGGAGGAGGSSTIRNVGNTNIEASAASAGGGSYMGECPAGGFEMGVQTIGTGIFAKRCKPLLYNEVVDAEERFHAGRPAGVAYLSMKEGAAREAFEMVDAVIDARPSQMTVRTDLSAMAEVETAPGVHFRKCEAVNGRTHITVKRGHDRKTAIRQCSNALKSGVAQPSVAATTVSCPNGSHWDGRGCWMPQ